MNYTTNNDIFCGWVSYVKRLNNSINGNPRYRVIVGNHRDKKVHVLKTREDEGWVYGINWHNLEGKQVHYTMDIESDGVESLAWNMNEVTPSYITILDSDKVEEKQEY